MLFSYSLSAVQMSHNFVGLYSLCIIYRSTALLLISTLVESCKLELTAGVGNTTNQLVLAFLFDKFSCAPYAKTFG
jgi:hypothetical protein